MARRPLVLTFVGFVVIGCTHDFGVFEGQRGDAAVKDTPGGVDGAGAPCTEPNSGSFGGHCYFPVSPVMTWSTAKTTCESASAHLVTITSSDEQSFVAGVDASNPHWIGLSRPDAANPTDPASFSWITGEISSFSAWQAGEPNGDGSCARMSSGTWDDWTCAGGFFALCERD
jgi:hypothetical protein